MSYSWVPFYHEVAQVLLGYENKQNELIDLLREMKAAGLPTIPLEDNQPDGSQKPLEVMEPFTFLANFARVETPQATAICKWLKAKWGLSTPVPTDFEGRAPVQARGGGSWFFGSVQSGRGPQDVERLWTLARQAYNAGIDTLDLDLLKTCLTHNNLGIRKLTNGLSWISPQEFLPLGGQMLPYLKAQGVAFDSTAVERRDVEAYRELMKAAREVDSDSVALTKKAWDWSKTASHTVMEPLPSTPLNRILYGPPGTGKTFNSIPRAVEIIDGTTPADRSECQRRFEELRRDQRIQFVTFHQNFSYEEFIEGLRPHLNGEDGEVRYEIRDGVLKEIALKALGAALQPVKRGKASFEDVWNRLLEKIDDEPDWQLSGLDASRTQFRLSVGEKGNLYGHNTIGDKYYQAPRSYIQKTWESLDRSIRPSDKKIRAVIGVGAATNLIGAVVEELRRLESDAKPVADEDLDRKVIAEAFLDGSPDYRAGFQNAPRFVLIVDEINRGNISRILGELITLLEDDKRLGQPNELRVTLPVSLETFALPPNLYLIGTMNTADKSLALLDIALRRRFVFEEIRPNFRLAGLKLSDEMKTVLETLNLRLEYALDREHCLGHAYFMGIETPEQFNAVFRAKIIPLLQEFFYNDWETLRGVLSESGKSGGFIRALEAPKGMKGRTLWRWWFDVERGEELDCLDVLVANYGTTAASDELG